MGGMVCIGKETDLTTIYELIVNHINFWKKSISTEYNCPSPPLASLISLDNFAESLFTHTRHEYVSGKAEKSFQGILMELHDLSMRSSHTKLVKIEKTDEKKKEEKLPTRPSHINFFKQKITENEKRNKRYGF